jgi:hypothetical protein
MPSGVPLSAGAFEQDDRLCHGRGLPPPPVLVRQAGRDIPSAEGRVQPATLEAPAKSPKPKQRKYTLMFTILSPAAAAAIRPVLFKTGEIAVETAGLVGLSAAMYFVGRKANENRRRWRHRDR